PVSSSTGGNNPPAESCSEFGVKISIRRVSLLNTRETPDAVSCNQKAHSVESSVSVLVSRNWIFKPVPDKKFDSEGYAFRSGSREGLACSGFNLVERCRHQFAEARIKPPIRIGRQAQPNVHAV